MELVTHALLGAITADAVLPERGPLRRRQRMVVAAAAAIFPDIDFLGFLVDPLRFLADWHQGPTHSLVLLPLWALLIGACAAAATAPRVQALVAAALASAVGIASHIAADLLTVYGTMVFYPLSLARVQLGTTYLVDPVLTGIALGTLVLALRRESRWISCFGLGALATYVALQGLLQARAIEVGAASLRARGIPFEHVVALPQPFLAFSWKLIAPGLERHHQAYLDLLGLQPIVPDIALLRPVHRMAAAYRPKGALDWQAKPLFGEPEAAETARSLWEDPRFSAFRRFALYPALSRMHSTAGEECVWFTDLRYDLPGVVDTFRYGFCRGGADGHWQMYRLRYFVVADRKLSHF